MASRDFGPIADDYAFFMTHSTEAELGAGEYVRELSSFAAGRSSISMLDFGSGGGEFTARVLAALAWTPGQLDLTLVEPADELRRQAAERLQPFRPDAVASLDDLTAGRSQFDVIISNHALYYVEALDPTVRRLIEWSSPGGVLLLAMAGWDNALLQFWQSGFAAMDRSVPYFAAEDVAAALEGENVTFAKRDVAYQIRFPDSSENRSSFARFLFGDDFDDLPPDAAHTWFDRYAAGGEVHIETHCTHFRVPPRDE